MSDSPVPAGLDAPGLLLWDGLEATRDVTGGNRALAVEACRIVDRLELLNLALAGNNGVWLSIVDNERTGAVELVIDKALAEARQQALALQKLISSLPLLAGDDDDEESYDPADLGRAQ